MLIILLIIKLLENQLPHTPFVQFLQLRIAHSLVQFLQHRIPHSLHKCFKTQTPRLHFASQYLQKPSPSACECHFAFTQLLLKVLTDVLHSELLNHRCNIPQSLVATVDSRVSNALQSKLQTIRKGIAESVHARSVKRQEALL